MNWFKENFGSMGGVVAGLAFSSLLLPASLWLLLVAAGLLHPAAFLENYNHWFVLGVGMLFGGIGIWTGPFGLPFLLLFLRVPAKAANYADLLLSKIWLVSIVMLGLAGYAGWQLRASLDPKDAFNMALGAIFLLAGTGSSLWLSGSSLMDRIHFGKVKLEPDEIRCAPGAEAAGVLTLEKRAASVEAVLELYGEGDSPTATRPAKAGSAAQTAAGWEYRVTAVLPKDAAVSEESCWVLLVKARGEHGGSYEGSIYVVPAAGQVSKPPEKNAKEK